jgi:hypothetical protein
MGGSGWLMPKIATSATYALAGIALLVGGCEKSQNRKPIVLNPTTRQSAPTTRLTVPVAIAPATKATTAPVKKLSHMLIKGTWVEFPEAKLILHKDGDKLNAFLVSNDPPEVINPTYQGNRYYFEMALDTIDDVKNIAQAEFRHKATSAEPQDTPNGVFLDGDRQHFEPYDIQVVFDQEGDHLIADIRGQFLYFPKGSVNGEWVPIMAQLVAKPEMK